jgi:hypothetical protein
MRSLRRLLGYISVQVDIDPELTTVGALMSLLDHFDRYPTEYLELFSNG